MNEWIDRKKRTDFNRQRRNSQVPETKDSETSYLETSSESRTGLWWAGSTTVDLQQKCDFEGEWTCLTERFTSTLNDGKIE